MFECAKSKNRNIYKNKLTKPTQNFKSLTQRQKTEKTEKTEIIGNKQSCQQNMYFMGEK